MLISLTLMINLITPTFHLLTATPVFWELFWFVIWTSNNKKCCVSQQPHNHLSTAEMSLSLTMVIYGNLLMVNILPVSDGFFFFHPVKQWNKNHYTQEKKMTIKCKLQANWETECSNHRNSQINEPHWGTLFHLLAITHNTDNWRY